MEVSDKGLLIVDDEPDILESLQRLFRRKYDVETCSSAEEAFNKLEQEPDRFSVLITDERMPDISGHELLTRLRDQDNEIVGILFTGYADTESLIKAVNEGHIFACQTKGGDPQVLKQMVAQAFVKHKKQENLHINQYVDLLTGLKTGTVLRDMLGLELDRCQRYDHRFACVMVNLRDLQMINELYEVEMEDMLVAGVASEMFVKIRGSDYLGRLSRDTFLAVLIGTDEVGSTIFRNRCLETLKEMHINPDGDPVSLEIAASSMALTAEHKLTVDQLLRQLEEELDSEIQSEFQQY